MNIMQITNIAFSLGLLLGSISLLSAVFVYVKHQAFGLAGVILVIFGSFLIGLSIWTSFEFSVGSDGSVTAKYTQDLGSKTADLNGNIEKLKLKLSDLTQDVAAIKQAIPKAAPSQDQLAKREDKERNFEQNSEYSVLVFYKSYQSGVALQISKALLSLGFRSSATPTDLKEAVQQFKPNQAWIVYTSKGQKKLPVLKEILASTGNKIEFIYRESPNDLRSGDIQILLF